MSFMPIRELPNTYLLWSCWSSIGIAEAEGKGSMFPWTRSGFREARTANKHIDELWSDYKVSVH